MSETKVYRFTVIEGVHHGKDRLYKKGDTFESPYPMDEMFVGKFQRLSDVIYREEPAPKRKRQYNREWLARRKQDPEWRAEREERDRQYQREWKTRHKQDPAWQAKERERNRKRTRLKRQQDRLNPEYCAKRREYGRRRYHRIKQYPEEMERQRKRDRERYHRMKHDLDWVERLNERIRKRWYKWYLQSGSYKERCEQRRKERKEIHKQRMENDPHYAYYHREYLKAKERERTGQTEIDPSRPR